MPTSFPTYKGAPDLLFPMDESGQTRFSHMTLITFTGSQYALQCAKFIREYTNRDGSQGLSPSHIGATSPYIDSNMIYLFFHDNALDAFTQDDADGAGLVLADIEATRVAAAEANAALKSALLGSAPGWRN
jgi:hypothetical protein